MAANALAAEKNIDPFANPDEYKDLFEEGGTLANIQDDWATATAQVQKDMFKGSRESIAGFAWYNCIGYSWHILM